MNAHIAGAKYIKDKKRKKGFMLRKSADLRVIAPTNSSK
jgi:hypothetical protein